MKIIKKCFTMLLSLLLVFFNCTSSFAMGSNVGTNSGTQFMDYEISNIKFANDKMYIYGYAYIIDYQNYNSSPKNCSSVADLKSKISGSYTHGYYLNIGSKNYLDTGGSDGGINYNSLSHTKLNEVGGASNNKKYEQVGFGFVVPLNDLLGTNSSQSFVLNLHVVLNDGTDSSIAVNYINSGQIMDAGNYTISYPAVSSSNYITPTGDMTLVRSGPDKSYSACKDGAGHNLYYKKGSQFTAYNGTLTNDRKLDANGVTWFKVRFAPTGGYDQIGGVTRYRVMPSSSGSYGWVAATFVDASTSTFRLTVTRKTYNVSTSITNGTITATSSVLSGNSKTITWNANPNFYVSSVNVNGTNISVSSRRGGSYTFSNVTSNQSISVSCNPCFSISTSISNGKITAPITGIDPSQNKTVSFSANSGYYVSQVIVDGHAYSYKDYASSYTFSNITSNHSINVICEPLKTITTTIENGIITKTQTDIHPDDKKDVIYSAYDDYYIDTVEVDGINISVNDFKEGNYEFNPVVTNHTIKVVCSPKPHISTNIIHGTITEDFKVYPGEDAKVRIRSNEGYYINKILIDGNEYKDFEEYEDVYKFTDVQRDHHVYVECVPMPEIRLSKSTDKDSYNYKDIIHYTIQAEQTVENAVAYNLTITDNDIPSQLTVDFNEINVTGINESQYTIEKTVVGFIIHVDELHYGETLNVSFDAKIENKLLVDKTIDNTVYASADHFNSQICESVANKILKPNLSISKTSKNEKYNVHDSIDYIIEVKQTVDGAKAFNVIIDDSDLSEGINIDFDSIVVEGITQNSYRILKKNNSFQIVIEELEKAVVIRYKAKVNDVSLAGKEVSNTASVTSLTNTDIKCSKAINQIYKPELIVSKTSDKDYYNVLDTAKFNISLNQSVEGARAFDVAIKDSLSDGIDIDMDSLVISGIGSDNYKIHNTDKGFEIIIEELTDEVVSITYDAKIIDNNVAGTDMANSVTATCENNPENVISTVTKPILKPELTALKTTDTDKYNVGDQIEYVMTVKQTVENAIANNVIISDLDLSQGVKLDLNTIRVEGIDDSLYKIVKKENGFDIIIQALAYNQTVKIKVKGIVESNSIAGESVSNSVTASCDNNNTIIKDSISSIILKPHLTIAKTSDKDIYNYKDIVHYKIVVHQTVQDARANDIVINDILDKGVDLDFDSIEVDGVKKSDSQLHKTESGFMMSVDALKEYLVIEYDAQINDPLLSGKQIRNYADVTCSNNSEAVTSEVESEVLKPQLEISKMTDKDIYNVNDVINYEIQVNQTVKDAHANDVIITDILDQKVNIDIDDISIEGTDKENYTVEKIDNGIVIRFKQISDKEITIKYQVLLQDNTLAGKEITSKSTMTSVNNPDIKTADKTSKILMPIFQLSKKSDKDFYNIDDTIHYTVKAKQIINHAKAFDVVIDDSHLNDGLTIDENSIAIQGLAENEYSIDHKNNGYIMLHEGAVTNEEIIIEYDVKVEDPSLAGQKVEHEVYLSCSNNPDVKTWKDDVEETILKPEYQISKTVNKEKCQAGDILEYIIDVKQMTENAKTFDIVIEDIAEGVQINLNSIVVEGINQSLYTILQTEEGFKILIHDENFDSCKIMYNGSTGNASEAINSVTISSMYALSQSSKTKTSVQKIVPTGDHEIGVIYIGPLFISAMYIFIKKRNDTRLRKLNK